jgi:hypothetical protein
MAKRPKELLDQVRDAIRLKDYSLHTEQSYVTWIKRYIFFHDKRHPKDMGSPEIEAFLTHLAVHQQVAASTQNQALSALLFVYRDVLRQPLDRSIDATRARKPKRLPTVLTKEEAMRVIGYISGPYELMAKRLYGNGMSAATCERHRFLPTSNRCAGWQGHGGPGHHASHKPCRATPGTFSGRQTPTCARLSQRVWLSIFTVCPGTKIPACRPTLDLAVRVPLTPAVERPPHGDRPPPSRQ